MYFNIKLQAKKVIKNKISFSNQSEEPLQTLI